MQTGSDFGRVTPLVLFEQPVKNLLPNDRPDGVAGPLPRVVEPVVKAAGLTQEVVPAIGPGDLFVDGTVNLAKFDNVSVHAALIVHQVVGRSQTPTVQHDFTAPRIEPITQGTKRSCQFGTRKGRQNFRSLGDPRLVTTPSMVKLCRTVPFMMNSASLIPGMYLTRRILVSCSSAPSPMGPPAGHASSRTRIPGISTTPPAPLYSETGGSGRAAPAGTTSST